MSIKYNSKKVSEIEPGSRGKVLKNLLGLKSRSAINKAEFDNYIRAENLLITQFDAAHKFNQSDVLHIHRVFLGNIYPWAGKLRDVNISKDGFSFASAFALPDAMKAFDEKVLRYNTPCKGTLEEAASKIAIVHTEFLLLHPFREGNGRTARLLATLMSYQAGFPGLDLSFIRSRGEQYKKYVQAVQAGLDENYEPMLAIILKALKLSLKRLQS
jgi:cell filamentation protein